MNRKQMVPLSLPLVQLSEKLERDAGRSVEYGAHYLGLKNGEPLIFIIDGLYRYASAYYKRYESRLCDDGALGRPWLDAITSTRKLLNGDGAVAMEKDISTNSKSNGVLESLFWAAMDMAGFKEEDI